MSHSTIFDKFTFIHNGDYHGEIEIVNRVTFERFTVDSEELFEFLAEYVRARRLSKIEQMSVNELLNI